MLKSGYEIEQICGMIIEGDRHMKVKLTLQEKLRDLRDERKLKLQDVADATGIPLATLGRIESNDDIRAGYQDIAILAKFYDVSTDYLFGVTDNRQHRHIEIDALALSDSAIEVLKNKKLNNRLISELLSHHDFQQLLSAMEVYIDKKLLPQMNQMNAIYKLAETTIKENYIVEDRDEVIDFLQNSVIDEDEFLRYRISERFNIIMKSLFEAHKKDGLPPEQEEFMNEMKEMVQGYLQDRKAEASSDSEARARLALLAKQIGLNIKDLTDDEIKTLMKALEKSEKYRRAKRGRR